MPPTVATFCTAAEQIVAAHAAEGTWDVGNFTLSTDLFRLSESGRLEAPQRGELAACQEPAVAGQHLCDQAAPEWKKGRDVG